MRVVIQVEGNEPLPPMTLAEAITYLRGLRVTAATQAADLGGES